MENMTPRPAKTATIIRGLLLAAAAALLLIGVLKGGPSDVKNKAIRICYECIGIG